MEDSQQLASRFREVILDGKWIANTNFKDQTSQLSWEQATQKIGSLNTVAALTFHIKYYIAGVAQVFEGGSLDIRDKYSFDMPAVKSEADWTQLKEELWADSERFASLVEQVTSEQLESPFVNEKYGSYRRNIEAMIEHAYYHLGQVSMLRKMILEG